MPYPASEPFDQGMLGVGDGHDLYWERVGNPHGKPTVVLHGGPGSGATPWWRTFFDPARYAVTLFDQRGCGRSRPLASDSDIDMSTITTSHLIADIEALRELHQIDRWLVFGGSWGSTLALAYAVEHPSRVSALVLWGVTTTTRHEVDWMTWSMGEVYPEAFGSLRALVPHLSEGDNLPAAYYRLLTSNDAAQRDQAARAWCVWEARLATLAGPPPAHARFASPVFRLGFARLVTHFFGNHGFLCPDAISGRLDRLTDLPAVFVRGRLDIASPLGVAWRLAQALPNATLHVVEAESHGGEALTDQLLVEATDRFATETGLLTGRTLLTALNSGLGGHRATFGGQAVLRVGAVAAPSANVTVPWPVSLWAGFQDCRWGVGGVTYTRTHVRQVRSGPRVDA